VAWSNLDLRGRDTRKTHRPKIPIYKRPRGRPPKYRGYDFSDDAAATADEVDDTPTVASFELQLFGDGNRQCRIPTKTDDVKDVPYHPTSVAVDRRINLSQVPKYQPEYGVEEWLFQEGCIVHRKSSDDLVTKWLAAGNQTNIGRPFARTIAYRKALPLPWFLQKKVK
jgi:hypothetical protein